jgi:pimeloyl-ACP methyl ester carboxylesterase
MTRVQSNGIELAYEVFGAFVDRPLVLVMGFAQQMITWPDEFCQWLADRGHFVVRFDNRDVGESTVLDGVTVPDVAAMIASYLAHGDPGDVAGAPYTLDDMADDTAGLITALGLESAHVCGMSMGGMIAQTLAYRHPERVRSLVSIMSTTGNPNLPQGRPEALQTLVTPPPLHDRDAFVDATVELFRTIGTPRHFDEPRVRDLARRQWDRGIHLLGAARQMIAIAAHGDRRERLKGVKAPTLVLHGDEDPLIPIEAGRDTAAAIEGASFVAIEGMGHDLPEPMWPWIVDAITRHTLAAESE